MVWFFTENVSEKLTEIRCAGPNIYFPLNSNISKTVRVNIVLNHVWKPSLKAFN